MPLPERIRNKPTLRIGLEFYWKAYRDLTSDRDIGMGVGPIPWQAMNNWGIRNHVYGDDFERLVITLQGLDKVFMDRQGKKNKHKSPMSGGTFEKPKVMGTK